MAASRIVILAVLAVGAGAAQTPAAEKPLAFEVASIKPNKSADPITWNFPLGPGDAYTPNGGYFSATNVPLSAYISFAYKIMGNQADAFLKQLPGWVSSERFDIQARAAKDPGKDGMRMMMRALLAERFKLVVHNETREVPVMALVVAKAGKLGPGLRPHLDDPPCASSGDTGAIAGGFPALCGGLLMLPPSEPGRVHGGGRNVTIAFIASSLSTASASGRPMLDQTGLAGTFDFSLEWAPELRKAIPPGVEAPEITGPSFEEALREQLGLKLESRKGSVEVILVDHVERPTEN